jgi:hypothetical protein
MRRNWREEARTAIGELKEAKYGDRETGLRALARRFNPKKNLKDDERDDPSSLRRAIVAYEFLEKLRVTHPKEYSDLDGVPLSVAELIARWYANDQEKALIAATDWARGKVTVQSIRTAMSESRQGYGGKVGAASERAYREWALPQLISEIQKLAGQYVATITKRTRDPKSGLKFDFLFESSSGDRPRRMAVLVIGPYKNPNMYRDRCDEWIARAFGTAWAFERVVLALPVKEYLDNYRLRAQQVTAAAVERLETSKCHQSASLELLGPSVDVIHIEVDPLAPEDSDAIARSGGRDD